MEQKLYTESDLVSFGKHILSLEREERVLRSHENAPPDVIDSMLRSVHDADIQNWLSETKDDSKDGD